LPHDGWRGGRPREPLAVCIKKKQTDGVSEFLQRAESEIQNRRLLSRGQKILVAVSGGADSMVLLHVLNSLAGKNRWQISVAHFNHQLRGRASDADEKLAGRTAKKLSLPFCAGRADVKNFAGQSKISVEMAARKLRHEFFTRLARERKIPVVALAHHADDQVELFFLRLLRGAGGEGLAGMKWRSPSPADKKITLVRPLLGFSKAEILAFARANKISFRDDATNFSGDFLRNRIRNELLPLLRKNYQPGLSKAVLRLMEIVGAESEFAGEAAQQWLAQSKIAFEELSVAVQRKVLQRQLVERDIAVDFELVERLRGAAEKFISISSGWSVSRDMAGKIQWSETGGGVEKKFNSDELKLKFQGGAGRVDFGGLQFCWDLKKFSGSRGRPPHQIQSEFFDADKVGGEIILRHWRAGDRFQPIGLRSAVKLQDLFVNAKIPAAHRRGLVLAATATGEIFWVEGLRLGEHFKLNPLTRRRLLWNWSKLAA
jgi:tRNA(Ile)-lysidine synthase